MADEPVVPAVEAPTPAVADVPAAEPAVETPAVVEAPAEAVAEVVAEPEVAPEPAVEAAPAEVLEPEKVEAPAEPVPPTYETFTLPEGIQASPEQVEAFTGIIGKFGLTQEAGQELMNLHAAELTHAAQQVSQHQIDTFEEMRAGWRKDFDKTAGNRKQTLVDDAKWLKNQILPTEKARAEFDEVMGYTGMGDHPAFINFMASAAAKLRERKAPAPALPARDRPTNPADRRYGAPARR